jgi:16S rRNA (guanine527-N7)-methyltransferase
MATLTDQRIGDLLTDYYPAAPTLLLSQLSTYLDLLLKWNARTNLTSIREPEVVVRRHFGESLFTERHLPPCATLLDVGSGAGFPGLPIQLARPALKVTLAESQGKKASFLREVIRTLGLKTEVWGERIESMPEDRRFDVVTLRAVDAPDVAIRLARQRLGPGGVLAHITSRGAQTGIWIPFPGLAATGLDLTAEDVPRGTSDDRSTS